MDDQKACTKCGRDLPIASFKRRSKSQGLRLSWCRDCVNAGERRLRERKRAAALGELCHDVRRSNSEALIEAVVKAACRRFGGCEAFGRRLADLMENDDPQIAFKAMELLCCIIYAPVPDSQFSRACRKAYRGVKKSAVAR